LSPIWIWKGTGTTTTGAFGRMKRAEFVRLTRSPLKLTVDAVREAIVAKAPTVVLKKALAETPGFMSLKSQLEAKALAGITSYEELLRVAG